MHTLLNKMYTSLAIITLIATIGCNQDKPRQKEAQAAIPTEESADAVATEDTLAAESSSASDVVPDTGAEDREGLRQEILDQQAAIDASHDELSAERQAELQALKDEVFSELASSSAANDQSVEGINQNLNNLTDGVTAQNEELKILAAKIKQLEQKKWKISSQVAYCQMGYTGAYSIIGCTATCPSGTSVTGGGFETGRAFSKNGRYAYPYGNGYRCGVNIDGCSEGSLGNGCNYTWCYAICSSVR